MPEFAQVGDFCPNKQCNDHGKRQSEQQQNIKKHGKTPKGCQRYRCETCHRTFTETKGTIFYRRHTPAEEIMDTLAFVAEGSRIRSLERVKGHKDDTILSWIRAAAAHAQAIEAVLLQEYQVSRGQLDALWAFVGDKGDKKGHTETAESGQFWRATMLDMDTRLRAARGIAKTETQASEQVFQTLQRRGHPAAPPPTVSDGWGGIDDAMVAVYGQVPKYKGKGRPPTRKQPQPGWQYLQVVKQHDTHGHFTGTKLRVIYGNPEEVLPLLGKSTAYIERTHLTMRLFNGRLTRKTLAFSKRVEMLNASACLEDLVYNLARPLKTLRVALVNHPKRRWQERTPAMAAKLTDHIWTVKELFCTVVPPNNT